MKKSRPNPHRVKIHRNYTVEEVARLFSVHKNTVRNWISDGLPVCDSNRPLLVLGSALREFLQKKRASKKRRCQTGELYCLRCREPRKAAGDMADFQLITSKIGNLLAICPVCEAVMNQRISPTKLDTIRAYLDVTITQAQKHIGDRDNPSVNSDFDECSQT